MTARRKTFGLYDIASFSLEAERNGRAISHEALVFVGDLSYGFREIASRSAKTPSRGNPLRERVFRHFSDKNML
jgi:hypothetical protein